MNSRMDRYYNDVETPSLKSRVSSNQEIYEKIKNSEIDKFDINSNATIIEDDINKVINVDKIKDMLDKQYRDDYKKKIIDLPIEEENISNNLIDTKEYDINNILEKAKKTQNIDYDKERLKKVHDTQYDILNNLDIKDEGSCNIEDTEDNIMDLINTITALEMKNKKNTGNTTALDLLNDLTDNETKDVYKTMELEKSKNTDIIDKKDETTNLEIDENFEDFKELQSDINSNNIAIKIVLIIFVLIILVVGFLVINKVFDLGII